MTRRLDSSARTLGLLLGLGDLQAREVCMGYQNACVCKACLARAENPAKAKPAPRQPWEVKAA